MEIRLEIRVDKKKKLEMRNFSFFSPKKSVFGIFVRIRMRWYRFEDIIIGLFQTDEQYMTGFLSRKKKNNT